MKLLNATLEDTMTSDRPSAIIKRKYTGFTVQLLLVRDDDDRRKRRRLAKTITNVDPQIERNDATFIATVTIIC